jgi:competence protein ComEC
VNPRGGHWRRLALVRVPFLPLVAAAAAGCLAGQFLAFEPGPVVAVAVGLLAGAWIFAGRVPRAAIVVLCGGIVAAFAAMHAWREHGSAAEEMAAAWPGPVVTDVRGVVAGVPREFSEDRSAFPVRARWVSFPGWSGAVDMPVQVGWRGAVPSPGDHVFARGSWSAFPPPRNPGAFDLARWMAGRGLYAGVSVSSPKDAHIEQAGPVFSPLRAAQTARRWIEGALTRGLDPDSRQAHIILAMTLGDTRPLEEALLEGFRGTGTFHLFSVSGLHVGMIGLILWFMLSTAGLPRTLIVAVVIPALFFYALVTGWKPASVRAAVMASFVLVGLVAGRPPVVLNSLLAAAFFLLLFNTRELFNPGFQLSFSVVAVLIVFCGPLTAWIGRPFEVDPFIPRRIHTVWERWRMWMVRRIAPLAGVAVAAWAGSAALTLGYFHLISFSAVPANMLCVPLAFCVMAVAMLSLVSAPLVPAVSSLFNHANWVFATALVGIVESFAAIPGSYVHVPARPWINHPTTLTLLDFGPGAGALLEARGRAWMVDCGPARDHDGTLLPFLRSRGVNRLDGLILTHGDAAHIGAAADLESFCRPRAVYESALDDRSPVRRRLRGMLAGAGRPAQRLVRGDRLPVTEGVSLHVVFPPDEIRSEYADDKALVLRLGAHGHRILLLSDAGPPTIAWLLEHAPEDLACDVLVKGKHHSGLAMDSAVLDAASPRALVVTAAAFPSSEHLPEETVRAAARRGIALHRQDRTGAVTIRLPPGNLSLEPFIKKPANVPP